MACPQDKMSGLFEADFYMYDENGQPQLTNTLTTPDGRQVTFGSFPFKYFINSTILGTRWYNHRYIVWPPPENAPPIGGLLTIDTFATATFELDGSAFTFPTATNFDATNSSGQSETTMVDTMPLRVPVS
mmetsp:Transcript_7304/g.21449  ORF Transcript_7304/g.21449 Transcript_7304/m.21449 type:complete len:130 (-) Transcript_7304:296-685(-)